MLKQNRSKKSDISAAAADAWLKQNPHRTAESMTGQLVPDSVICKISRSTQGVVTKANPYRWEDFNLNLNRKG